MCSSCGSSGLLEKSCIQYACEIMAGLCSKAVVVCLALLEGFSAVLNASLGQKR